MLDLLSSIPGLVWLIILVVIASTFWTWQDISSDFCGLLKNLEKILTTLKGYKTQLTINEIEEIEEIFINAKFKNNYYLKDIWVEFEETIEKDKRSNKVYNTLQTEDFFNNQSIITANIKHLEMVKSMPAILTALGLLGTFLAILIGLNEVEVLQGGQVKGMEGLINGLAGKFASSIIALGCSIVITLREKIYHSRLTRIVSDMQRCMNKIFPRRSAEKLLIELLRFNDEQTAALKSFSTDMSGHLKVGISEGINPLIEKLVNSIDEIKKEKQQSSESAITNLVSDFKSSLTGAAGAEITNMANVLQGATEVMSNFAQNNKELENRVNFMINSLETTINNQQSQFKKYIEDVNEIVAGQTNDIKNILDTLSERISEYKNLVISTQELRGGLENIIGKLTNAGENFAHSASSFENINISIEQLKELSRQDLERFNESINQWNTQTNAIKTIENSISNILDKVHESLVSYSQQTNNSLKEYLAQYDNQMSNVTKHFSLSIQEFDEKLEDLNEVLQNKIGANN